jgi:lipid II:glycine glycyltransferase (peptidoglycan interpeptide bridge formation enzyme)
MPWKEILDESVIHKMSTNLISFYNIPGFDLFYKSKNWKIVKLIYFSDFNHDNFISFTQVLVKKKFGINFLYIPGGIEGELKKTIVEDLYCYLNRIYGFNTILFVKLFQATIDIQPNKFLKIFNFHETRSYMKINIDNVSDIRSLYSKNWRHNLNRSYKHNYKVLFNENPNFEEMSSLYRQMSQIKKTKLEISKKYLEEIFKYLNKYILHVEAHLDNKLIAFRTVLIYEKNSWDLFACSNLLSKKNYATYNLFNQILDKIKKQNISSFDFSGVDKKNNIGVYNFKKGGGGIEHRILGEYVISPNYILKFSFFIFVIFKRLIKR